MKVLIMVLSGADPLYRKLMLGQQQTWDSINVKGVETIYYYGGAAKTYHNFGCTEIVCACPDIYNMMHWKFKMALDHIWELDFDFIFRTNSSTYVRKEKIYEFLKDKPKEKYYAGVDGGGYASGTGAILSRDCAKIIKDQFIDEPSPSEDSLMGVYLQRNGIFVQEGPKRLNYNFAEFKILEADYYRCKSEVEDGRGGLDRNWDLIAFNELQKFHYK